MKQDSLGQLGLKHFESVASYFLLTLDRVTEVIGFREYAAQKSKLKANIDQLIKEMKMDLEGTGALLQAPSHEKENSANELPNG